MRSQMSALEPLPHHDKRRLLTDVWADFESPGQLQGCIDLACLRDPADVADAPVPASAEFCRDFVSESSTKPIGVAPPLSLATLLAVYRHQAVQPPEARVEGGPTRFWVPIGPPIRASHSERKDSGLQGQGQVVGGEEQDDSRPLRAEELEELAVESRTVLGMWVEWTKRTRPQQVAPISNLAF